MNLQDLVRRYHGTQGEEVFLAVQEIVQGEDRGVQFTEYTTNEIFARFSKELSPESFASIAEGIGGLSLCPGWVPTYKEGEGLNFSITFLASNVLYFSPNAISHECVPLPNTILQMNGLVNQQRLIKGEMAR